MITLTSIVLTVSATVFVAASALSIAGLAPGLTTTGSLTTSLRRFIAPAAQRTPTWATKLAAPASNRTDCINRLSVALAWLCIVRAVVPSAGLWFSAIWAATALLFVIATALVIVWWPDVSSGRPAPTDAKTSAQTERITVTINVVFALLTAAIAVYVVTQPV